MLKRRDPNAIGNVGKYTVEMSNELKAIQTKLLNDINSISEVYKGIDADEQVNGFITTVNKMDLVIKNFENYGSYMNDVSSIDMDNITKTNNSFEATLATISEPIAEASTSSEIMLDLASPEDLASQNFSMETIMSIENGGE